MMSPIESMYESDLSERVKTLKEVGYRGFMISGSKQKFEGVEIIVENKKGMMLNAEGDNLEEAYKNMVDLIDQALDEKI